MAVVFEKRQLVITLGENETPSAYQFLGVKTFTDDSTGESSQAQSASVDATREEVDAVLGQGVADMTAQLAAATQALGDANTTRDAAVTTATELNTKMALLITTVGNAAKQAHDNAQAMQGYIDGVLTTAVANAQGLIDFVAQLRDAHDEQLAKMAEAAKS